MRLVLVCLVGFCAYLALQIATIAPDRSVYDFDHTTMIGADLNSVNAIFASRNVPVAQATYFALADYLSYGPPDQGSFYFGSGLAPQTQQRAEETCNWECTFLMAQRTDRHVVLGITVQHRALF
jgi:hypothetical protein